MLFENRKQISAKDLMLKYATLADYNKILKAPSFEIAANRKKIDRANGGRIKVPKGFQMRSHFYATDKATDLKVEIRYARSANTKIVGDRVVDVFEPRYVETKGATFAHQNDIDLAVFKFLSTNSALSPLRPAGSTVKPKYEFIDTKKRSEAKMDSINSYADAITHAKQLNTDRMLILAKGLGIKGIDKKEPEDIRVDVLEFAMKNPAVYLQKSATEITYIEGRIINLVDKGIIKLSNVGAIRRWSWTSGEREGEHILDIQNVTQDAKAALKNFFFDDINRWRGILESTTNDISAREKAIRALQMEEEKNTPSNGNPAHQEEKVIGDALPAHLRSHEEKEEFQLPEDNTKAMELLSGWRDDGKAPSWSHVNRLMSAIGAQEVTPKNIRDWVKINIGY